MKTLNYSVLFRSIFALILGLILVLFPDRAIEMLVIIVGVIFLVPSLLGIIRYVSLKDKSVHHFPVEALGGMLLGLWLIVNPVFFTSFLTVVLGLLLVVGGIQQIVVLLMVRRSGVPVALYSYIMPILILLMGVLALYNPFSLAATLFMVVGYTAIVYAVVEVINWILFVRKMETKRKVEMARKGEAEDAEIIE